MSYASITYESTRKELLAHLVILQIIVSRLGDLGAPSRARELTTSSSPATADYINRHLDVYNKWVDFPAQLDLAKPADTFAEQSQHHYLGREQRLDVPQELTERRLLSGSAWDEVAMTEEGNGHSAKGTVRGRTR